ncbi:MAG: DinB family protein [Gemmatimonadales bacterium]
MKTLSYAWVVFIAVAAPSLLWAQTPAPSQAKELAATFQRAATEILDVAEAMPADKYGYKPTPEVSSFGDQLVHVAGVTQRFIDAAKGTKTEAPHHGAMAKPEIIALLKKTFQTAQEMIAPLTDAQMLEPVKFPFGDRTVTRATFWQGPLFQIRNHYGQLVVYLRMNGIVPPASVRR